MDPRTILTQPGHGAVGRVLTDPQTGFKEQVQRGGVVRADGISEHHVGVAAVDRRGRVHQAIEHLLARVGPGTARSGSASEQGEQVGAAPIGAEGVAASDPGVGIRAHGHQHAVARGTGAIARHGQRYRSIHRGLCTVAGVSRAPGVGELGALDVAHEHGRIVTADHGVRAQFQRGHAHVIDVVVGLDPAHGTHLGEGGARVVLEVPERHGVLASAGGVEAADLLVVVAGRRAHGLQVRGQGQRSGRREREVQRHAIAEVDLHLIDRHDATGAQGDPELHIVALAGLHGLGQQGGDVLPIARGVVEDDAGVPIAGPRLEIVVPAGVVQVGRGQGGCPPLRDVLVVRVGGVVEGTDELGALQGVLQTAVGHQVLRVHDGDGAHQGQGNTGEVSHGAWGVGASCGMAGALPSRSAR